MPQQTLTQFYQTLRACLGNKGYTELRPVAPIQLALIKHGVLGAPYVVAVKDAIHSTDTPQQTYDRVKGWVKQLTGNSGAGVLLFVYSQPLASDIDAIQQLGTSELHVGAHDLFTAKHWLTNHMGWEQELYDC